MNDLWISVDKLYHVIPNTAVITQFVNGPEKASSKKGILAPDDRIIPRVRLGVWCGTGICQLMDCDNAQCLGCYPLVN